MTNTTWYSRVISIRNPIYDYHFIRRWHLQSLYWESLEAWAPSSRDPKTWFEYTVQIPATLFGGALTIFSIFQNFGILNTTRKHRWRNENNWKIRCSKRNSDKKIQLQDAKYSSSITSCCTLFHTFEISNQVTIKYSWITFECS